MAEAELEKLTHKMMLDAALPFHSELLQKQNLFYSQS